MIIFILGVIKYTRAIRSDTTWSDINYQCSVRNGGACIKVKDGASLTINGGNMVGIKGHKGGKGIILEEGATLHMVGVNLANFKSGPIIADQASNVRIELESCALTGDTKKVASIQIHRGDIVELIMTNTNIESNAIFALNGVSNPTIQIDNCVFTGTAKKGYPIRIQMSENGNLAISNTQFSSSPALLEDVANFEIQVDGSQFTGADGRASLTRISESSNTNIEVTNTKFLQSAAFIVKECSTCGIQVDQCEFRGYFGSESPLHMEECSDSNLTLSNSLFTENNADYGGGLHIEHMTNVIINNCNFTFNEGFYKAGGMRIQYADTMRMSNCIIEGNKARGSGGGIYMGAIEDAEISSTQILNNEAGAELYREGHCGVQYDGWGGGIKVFGTPDAEVFGVDTLTIGPNVVVRGNKADYGNGIDCSMILYLDILSTIDDTNDIGNRCKPEEEDNST